MHELSKDQYDKLLQDNITYTYRKTNDSIIKSFNKEANDIAVKIGIEDRIERMAKNQAFITLKDHKENFINNPKCSLINPTKSDIGRISKQILEKINKNIRETSKYHQWRNTSVVIAWFKNIPDKNNHTFTQFDIQNFYPSISEDLLHKALSYARTQVYIPNDHLEIIFHARKSLLFDKNISWIKKNNDSMFDVTMGSNDGAEVCELVGLYILSILSRKYQKSDIGLYRDDGLEYPNQRLVLKWKELKKTS